METVKHLGNCPLDEFMPQAVKLREPLRELVKRTKADEIRHKYSDTLTDDADDQQMLEAFNGLVGEIEDACFEKCPELTLEVLRIATFTDNDGPALSMPQYENAAIEMYLNRNLRNFFSRCLKPNMKSSSKG